jgi:hypothetical protein
MQIKNVLAEINRMQADGVIASYAIGGAVGATFYLEPAATLDIDIFVGFETRPGSLLISPQPIYDYLTRRGHTICGEHIEIADWPVQFLPPTGPLAEEALAEAQPTDVDGEPTRVFSAEHLVAIALETGRGKDMARILQFLDAGVLDADKLQAILARHGLAARWATFEKKFLGDAP